MTNPEPRVLEQVKSHATEVENAEKPVPIVDKVDYSGAHEKTDPKEIALVKKLDRWIMVGDLPDVPRKMVMLTLGCLANVVEHVLAQLS
jgi:hypothetical protein